MEEKFRRLILVPIAAALCFMLGYQYVCPAGSDVCSSGGHLPERHAGEEHLGARSSFNFTPRDLERRAGFDIRGDDVMVFLHIQKTGGTTFGRHLVRNIQLEQPCQCLPGQRKCTCHRPGKTESWLFSRFSTGWSCGLHADWTELTSCVPLF